MEHPCGDIFNRQNFSYGCFIALKYEYLRIVFLFLKKYRLKKYGLNKNKIRNYLKRIENPLIFALALGEMAEWSNAAVLKTVEGHTSGGSNPSFSAKENPQEKLWVFCF